jgi:hypothetical protein
MAARTISKREVLSSLRSVVRADAETLADPSAAMSRGRSSARKPSRWSLTWNLGSGAHQPGSKGPFAATLQQRRALST